MTGKGLGGGNGFLLPLLIGGLGGGILAGAQTSQQTAPKVTVGKQLTAKASAPSPGATAKNATQKASIGKGATSVKASQPSLFWTEELDVDDDGTIETSDYLYDAKRGSCTPTGKTISLARMGNPNPETFSWRSMPRVTGPTSPSGPAGPL